LWGNDIISFETAANHLVIAHDSRAAYHPVVVSLNAQFKLHLRIVYRTYKTQVLDVRSPGKHQAIAFSFFKQLTNNMYGANARQDRISRKVPMKNFVVVMKENPGNDLFTGVRNFEGNDFIQVIQQHKALQ
jgi:hypothetical protein